MLTYLFLSVLWILQQAVCRKIILWGDILDVPSHQFCLVQCSWFSELKMVRMQKRWNILGTMHNLLTYKYVLKYHLKSTKRHQRKSIWHFIFNFRLACSCRLSHKLVIIILSQGIFKILNFATSYLLRSTLKEGFLV